jgi:hypothetical protein
VTELVDVIKIEITLRHCRDGLRIQPLREWLRDNVAHVASRALNPAREGEDSYENGKVDVRWSHTGLHEIPEVDGGDN